MPRLSARSSSPPVSTRSPRLPITIAVPVSWHIGSTPPAAMLAFFSRSRATKRSLAEASGSSRMRRSCARWAGRSQWAMSWNAVRARSVSASGSTSRNVRPAASTVAHAVGGEQAVGRVVGAEREELGERRASVIGPAP